jgi:hypothetical protein
MNSTTNNDCPKGIVDRQGNIVKINSGYCRNVCDLRNYKEGTPDSDIVICYDTK